MKTLPVFFMLCTICFSLAAAAAVIHVPVDQPTIQAGIDAAMDGDTVLVGPGTYSELIDFSGKNIVVRSTSGPEMTIIDGDGISEGGSVAAIGTGSGPETILEGFTITNGRRGGITCWNSSPTITNNIISNNGYLETYGGDTYAGGHGIRTSGGSPTISSNLIIHNTGSGGIVDHSSSSGQDGAPLIIDNWIYDNQSWGLHLCLGGGIDAGPGAIIIGNVIEGNRTSLSIEFDAGGGVFGGGLIEDNQFIDNDAT
jgi:serine protease